MTNVAVNSNDKSLAAAPLTQVVPRVAALLSKMKIDDVAALLSGLTPMATSRTLDEIARAILDLPAGGHRLRDVERTVVAHALVQTNGNVSAAARLLGTDRKSLERRIERHKLAVPRAR
jgi:DNA-binding NtrC family response regulator